MQLWIPVPPGCPPNTSAHRAARRAVPLFYTGVSCLDRTGSKCRRRFQWATVGCGGSRAWKFTSRWWSKGGKHASDLPACISCMLLTCQALPVSRQKVTVLDLTFYHSSFLLLFWYQGCSTSKCRQQLPLLFHNINTSHFFQCRIAICFVDLCGIQIK